MSAGSYVLHETRNLRVERLIVLRHDLFFDFAFAKIDDTVGERLRVLFIVRDEDSRRPRLFEEAAQIVPNAMLERRVQVAERLIQDEERRFRCERTRERDTLLLTTTELVWIAMTELGQVHERQHLFDALVPLLPAQFMQTETDVLLNSHMREERIVLEHHPDTTLFRRHELAVVATDTVVDDDDALVRHLEPRDEA